MAVNTIALTDPRLRARFHTFQDGGQAFRSLWFECPLCWSEYCWHAIPFGPNSAKTPSGQNVWKIDGEESVGAITLSPSYLSNPSGQPSKCRLHVFVRAGQLQILADSKVAKPAP